MPEYALYKLTVSVITPLHIGSGVELMHEYDYAIFGGKTWRINDAALLDAQTVDDPAIAERLAATPPRQLLRDADFQPGSAFFRYVIQGTPRSQAEGAILREQLKDTFDRPYIPGSSLKGALRTALAWQLWKEKEMRPEAGKLERSRQHAGQKYEQMLFGPTPNKDLLRALQISDSLPVGAERLMVLNAGVLGRSGGLGSSIKLEAIKPDTTFELTARVDLALFSRWAQDAGLRLNGQEALLRLPEVVNAHSQARIQRELAWYSGINSAKRVAGFYQQLAQSRLEGGQFLLQLGWGTGWEDKTLGSRLTADSGFMETIIRQYRLAKGQRRSGDPFPKSRRVVMLSQKSASGERAEMPAYPLGWVLCELRLASQSSAGWEKARALPSLWPEPRPTAGAPPRPAPTPQPAPRSATSQAKPPPQPETARFSAPPKGGERFRGTLLERNLDGSWYVELPGLSADEVIGLIPPAEAGTRRLRAGETILLEAAAVRPDPQNKGGWIVDCRPISKV